MADQDYPSLYAQLEAELVRVVQAAIAYEQTLGGSADLLVPVNGYPDQPTIAKRVNDALALVIPNLQEFMSLMQTDTADGILFALCDGNRQQTWLGVNSTDGGPTPWAQKMLSKYLGSLMDDIPGYLFALSDANGLLTDLSIRSSDGQFSDFVVQRLANRLIPLLPIPEVDEPTKTAYNNITEMRKTRMKFGRLETADANTQLNIAFIGDSYTAGQPYYLRELCKRLAKAHGFSGPGFIGFNHGSSLGDSNFLYNTTNPAYFGGSWVIAPLGTASPDNRSITAGAVGDYIGIQAVEAANISTLVTAAKLMYLGDGTDPVVRYRWADADPWQTLTLTGNGALSVPLAVLPVGINWKFRMEVVSGLPTLFGIFASNSANGITCSKLAASGSSTGDWYKPGVAGWMTQWKASVSQIPADVYMVMLGGNDQGLGVAPATVLANLQGIYAALKEINPSADIHFTIRQDTSRVSLHPMSAYAEPVRKWAWPLKIPCSDMQYAFGTNPVDYASDGILPLIDTDKTHPISATGGRLITEFFYRLLHTGQ